MTEVSHHEAIDLAHLYRRPFCEFFRGPNSMSVTPYYIYLVDCQNAI